MDTQSPDARALMWTGLFVAVVAVAGVIALAVLT